jgi:hypothetical protein
MMLTIMLHIANNIAFTPQMTIIHVANNRAYMQIKLLLIILQRIVLTKY